MGIDFERQYWDMDAGERAAYHERHANKTSCPQNRAIHRRKQYEAEQEAEREVEHG